MLRENLFVNKIPNRRHKITNYPYIKKTITMRIYNYPSITAEKKVSAIVNRGLSFSKKDYKIVSRILEDVRRRGDEAVIEYARRFDAPRMTLESLKVSANKHSKRGSETWWYKSI